MNSRQFSLLMSRACATVAMLLLFGCGGGGGGTSASVSGGIGGTGVKGPVSGATVTAFKITNGAKGAQISTGTTNAQGNFNLSMGNYGGPVMLQLSSGSYTNEATGSTMNMPAGDVMTAVIPDFTAGTTMNGIQITPLTAMAQEMAQHMAGGMTAANIAAANTAMGHYFSTTVAAIDILHTQPIDPLTNNSGVSASQDARICGMVLAAMSQYANTLNPLMNTSDLVTAMMNDATDGVMNGMMSGGGAISMSMGGGMMGTMAAHAGTSDLATAMTTFINSNANASGVKTTDSDMAALITKLNGSNGIIQ